MSFKVDFSELDELKNSLKILEEDYNDFLKDFLLEMANRVIAKVKPRTPKITGALRGAWQLGEITGSGKEIAVEINNPMEYADFIEYGHRIVRNGVEVGWYEGRFMLKISIDEIDRQMPLRYERKFVAFCVARGINVN